MSAIQQILASYGGEAPFSPADIPGLTMWLDASQITGLIDGANVTTWEDASGNNNDATCAGVPSYVTYQTNEVNGLPVVRSSGTSAALVLADLSALTAGEGFIISKQAEDPPVAFVGTLWRLGNGGATVYVPFSNGTVYDNFGATDRNTTADPATSFAGWNIYSAYSAANDWANYINGSQITQTGTNTVGFASAGFLASGINVDIAEVILYDSKLSTENRALIVAYAQAKYAF